LIELIDEHAIKKILGWKLEMSLKPK